nr:1-acyl-sn-glycerol-3-phosphate acyltransferase [Oscillospiraceae bacterium]
KTMDKIYERHQRTWRVLYAMAHRSICGVFRLTHDDLRIDGPCLIIPNHVSAWDPLLVAMSLREKQAYYVASEHIFRQGLLTSLLDWLVAPIPRKKGASGTDTVKACLRHLKNGHSVCLFAEGEQCWDGRSGHIFPATGKLARVSSATLVTFRIEGAYLSQPRWGKHIRRGRVHVGPVHIYPPEQLKSMTPEQINAVIETDIHEDAWERQKREPVKYQGKRPAEGLEKALYLCPGCRRVGTLKTEKDRLFCSCGLSVVYTDRGSFAPENPFANLAEWEDWQRGTLRLRGFEHGEHLFSDRGIRLSRLLPGHREEIAETGDLIQYEDRIICGEHVFPLAEIRDMAMVQASWLLFSCHDEYWQIRSEGKVNLRKYLEIWKDR